MRVKRLGVLVPGLKFLESLRRLAADGDDLEWEYIDIARIDAADVVGKAEALATLHPREMEARDLSQRSAIARVRGRVVDDDVVSLRLRREIAVDELGFDPAILFRVFLEALQRGLELILDR